VANILLRGEYNKFARGTWVVQTGLHLPQRRAIRSLLVNEGERLWFDILLDFLLQKPFLYF
jgi:hypothetical protein